MKQVITFILLFLSIATFAQQKIAREYIEWSDNWIPGANKTDLPHVLLIGNSITRGYYGEVEQALKNKAYVGRLSNWWRWYAPHCCRILSLSNPSYFCYRKETLEPEKEK